MHPAYRNAAKLLRARLVAERLSPTLMRSVLRGVAKEDHDAFLDLVLDVGDVCADEADLPQGCVPYLPCPVSIVIDALEQARVTATDVFVDVGAGMGRPLFLAHLLTGAGGIGIEVQSILTQLASGRAQWLNLTRTRFIHGDAIELIPYMTVGSVFFLYCPFSGERLERFLDGLESIARTRQIRVCCVDMAPLQRSWLTRLASTTPELDLYISRALPAG